jgi:hypothetical protein
MLIVPIQISINPFHKDSEACFYAGWQQWVKHFEDYTLSSTFVRIVEHDCSSKIIDEHLRALRDGTQLIAPQYEQMYITMGDVYGPLGERLQARARHMGLQSAGRSLRLELTFASDVRSRATESQDDRVCKAGRTSVLLGRVGPSNLLLFTGVGNSR